MRVAGRARIGTGLDAEPYALLDVELPLVRIPVRPGRSNAMLIETAARNHLLQRRGAARGPRSSPSGSIARSRSVAARRSARGGS